MSNVRRVMYTTRSDGGNLRLFRGEYSEPLADLPSERAEQPTAAQHKFEFSVYNAYETQPRSDSV